jgi:hypothetical protein
LWVSWGGRPPTECIQFLFLFKKKSEYFSNFGSLQMRAYVLSPNWGIRIAILNSYSFFLIE